MRALRNITILTGLIIGFLIPKAFGQQFDTVYSNGFEQPLNTPVSSDCNQQWERTSDSASEGQYSLRFRSSIASQGCVTFTGGEIFNLSNIDPNDTLFFTVDMYKSRPLSNQADLVQFLLVDDQGNSIAPVNLFRNTQRGVTTNTPGWLGISAFITGQRILDSTSSNSLAFQFFGLSGGDGADMAIDDFTVIFADYNTDFANLIQPNGGEQIEQGANYNIQWNASSSINQVDLAFSDDNGSTWSSIASNINAGQGSYNWTVPNTTTSQGLVRVRASNDPSISDVSQSTFSITDPEPEITISNPTPFTTLQVAKTTTIEWNSLSTDQVDIEYSSNGGTNWARIKHDADASAGTYEWIPNASTSNPGSGLIRILNASDRSYGDTVEGLTVESGNSPALTLAEPKADDTFKTNAQVNIEWVANDLVSQVDIEFSDDGGTNWNEISTGVDATDGSFEWTTPSNPVSNAEIRVIDADNVSIVDRSGIFEIVDEIRTLSLNRPQAGDTVEGGSNYSIQWAASASVNEVMIEFSDDGGSTWSEVASNVSASQESYDWSVPTETVENAMLRITDETESTVKAESGNFYIDGSTSIQSMETSAAVNLYPSPAHEKLNIELPNSFDQNNIQVQVMSIDGRIQPLSGYQVNEDAHLNISNLSNGIYYVKIKNDGTQYIGKFVKQ